MSWFILVLFAYPTFAALGATGPAWTYDKSVEKPAGEKNMGSWTESVYTPEQMARLGVDESGKMVIPQAPAVIVANPSFESDGSWAGGLARGSSELFAPPHAASYASINSGGTLTQTVGTLQAGKTYTATVWARSLNAYIPDTAPGDTKGMQKTHPNLLATAKMALKSGTGTEIASVEIIVSANASVIAGGHANAQDDGANIFLTDGYRIHAGNTLLYQDAGSDPIGAAPWTLGNENGGTWGMAVAPVSRLDGSLQIKALGGGFTWADDLPAGKEPTSRIELAALVGAAPGFVGPQNGKQCFRGDEGCDVDGGVGVGTCAAGGACDFMGPVYDTVLKHVGDEDPWVFDPHYCYDDESGRLWMVWGGHSGFISEVHPNTGKVIDPATREEPASTEFDTHAEGVHTKVLTGQRWNGKQVVSYDSQSEAPEDWGGDAFQSQGYMEGLGLLKKGGYFHMCGSYGSMGDSYTIRCCRQAANETTAPRGPYVDKTGGLCTEFTDGRYPATMLLGPDGNHLVPGHPHFWEEGDKLYLGYDYRTQVPSVAEDSMAIRRLYVADDGWLTIWMPITVEFTAGAELDGQELTVELGAGGDSDSKVGFDHVRVVVTSALSVPKTRTPSSPTTPAAPPTSAATPAPGKEKDNGPVIGGVVGGILGAVVLAGVAYMLFKPEAEAAAKDDPHPVPPGQVEQQLA